jgi:hypothetical protein
MLSQETKQILERNKNLFDKLCNKKLKEKSKYQLVKKYWEKLVKLFNAAKKILIKVLKL